jgi:ankyrin repeat protein
VAPSTVEERAAFERARAGLHRGDFSLLAPEFTAPTGGPAAVTTWLEHGWFADDPAALHEALSCACFLGQTMLVEYLLAHGADLLAGARTGLNGFHWAANREQLDTVQALVRHRMPLEARNSYGGTVLGSTIWAAVHEPRPAHLAIIEALLEAGARIEPEDYPSGDPAVDAVLRRHASSGRLGEPDA